MTTLYPGALDTKVAPTSTETTNNPVDATYGNGHAACHIFEIGAIEALEAKVGINGSLLTTTFDYKLALITGSEQAASTAYVNSVITGFTGTATTSSAGTTFLSTNPATPGHPVALNSEEVSVTAGDNLVPRANGSGKIDTAYLATDVANGVALLNGSSLVIANPANATATPTASKIPIADGSGTLNGWINPAALAVPYLQASFTAGQAITKGDAVTVSDGSLAPTVHLDGSGGSGETLVAFNPTTSWVGNTFTTPAAIVSISSVVVYLSAASGSPVITLSIRATSAGLPTGADLTNSTVSATVTTGGAVTFAFSPAVVVSPNTEYAIIVRSNQNLGKYNVANAGSGFLQSSNSGSTWATNTGYLTSNSTTTAATYTYTATVAGKLYRASSAASNELSANFIGFATASTALGSSCVVDVGGIDNNQTGLTIGAKYYLADSAGQIGSSAGTTSVIVGLAVSATQILIKQDNI